LGCYTKFYEEDTKFHEENKIPELKPKTLKLNTNKIRVNPLHPCPTGVSQARRVIRVLF
jgi:hypothetical protein